MRGQILICPQISEQMIQMLTADTLIAWAKELGFCEAGFCSPDDFDAAWEIVQSQPPLAERKQLRFHPVQDDPQIKSIAVLLWPYLPAPSGERNRVFVDSYYGASNAAYQAARFLEAKILEAGCFARANVAYPAKEAAVRANMGVIGQHSLLITPAHGSRVVIILMATGIEISHTASSGIRSCIRCGKCIKACPTGAIDEEGMTHPERCLRNYMMEGIVIPVEMRAKMGMRLIGCDICQRACPMQAVDTRPESTQFQLSDFLTNDSQAFSRSVALLAQEIGRNIARPQRVRAQAAILAGNSKDPVYLPVLHAWAQLPFDAVREHALWAIEQIELANRNT